MIVELLMVIIGVLSGAVMYSYYIPKWILKKDIRKNTTDANPGGYNAYSAHKGIGLVCILLDMLKGFIPVYLFVRIKGIETPWITFMVLAPVLGHAFTPFLKGKGGKALSTAAGSMLGLTPASSLGILLVTMAIFFSFVLIIDPFASRVVGVMLVFNIVTMLFRLANLWLTIASWGITGILWYKQLQVRDPRRAVVYWWFSKNANNHYRELS